MVTEEPDRPKTYFLDPAFAAVKRAIIVLSSLLVLLHVYQWWTGGTAANLWVLPAYAGIILIISRLSRGPVAELHADHVRLRDPLLRLQKIPYGNILKLERIPGLYLSVTYRWRAGKRKAFLSPTQIVGFPELEAGLVAATGLPLEQVNPLWARPVRIYLQAFPAKELASVPVLLGYLAAGIVSGVVVVIAAAFLCNLFGIRTPSWLILTLPALTALGTLVFLVNRRARQRLADISSRS